MELELSAAQMTFVPADDTDTGLDTYRVTAYDQRFGDCLIVAEFSFDNTHENGFYKDRAQAMAETQVALINGKATITL
jgi:hypothetical protein